VPTVTPAQFARDDVVLAVWSVSPRALSSRVPGPDRRHVPQLATSCAGTEATSALAGMLRQEYNYRPIEADVEV